MHKSPLSIHQIELVIKSSPGLSDCRGVGQHADAAGHLGQVTSRHHGRGLVVDSNFEPGGAPVHELDGPLGLDGGDSGVDILGNHVTPVEHAAGHVLAVPGVALHHLVGGLEAGVGDLTHRQLLVIRLLCRDNRGVHGQREVNPKNVNVKTCNLRFKLPLVRIHNLFSWLFFLH